MAKIKLGFAPIRRSIFSAPAGMELGFWQTEIFDTVKWDIVSPKMETGIRRYKYEGYKNTVRMIRHRKD